MKPSKHHPMTTLQFLTHIFIFIQVVYLPNGEVINILGVPQLMAPVRDTEMFFFQCHLQFNWQKTREKGQNNKVLN
jgi:hypothetical protein